MHKRIVNQAIIELTISPVGPLTHQSKRPRGGSDQARLWSSLRLIYAGDRSVYLPGSSLKGAIRAHCERIVRTLGRERPNVSSIWTCDPFKDKANTSP